MRNSLLLEEYFRVMEQFYSTLSSLIDSTLGLRCRLFHFMARFLAMVELKQARFYSSGLTKTFHFMARFLAMAELILGRIQAVLLTLPMKYISYGT